MKTKEDWIIEITKFGEECCQEGKKEAIEEVLKLMDNYCRDNTICEHIRDYTKELKTEVEKLK